MESCPSQNEHWVTSASAAYLIDGVFSGGGGGACPALQVQVFRVISADREKSEMLGGGKMKVMILGSLMASLLDTAQ